MTFSLPPYYLYALPRCPCGKPAEEEVRGPRNEVYGVWCARCAPKRLKQLNEAKR